MYIMQVVVQEAHIKVQVLVELEQVQVRKVEEVQVATKDIHNMVLQQEQLIKVVVEAALGVVVQELLYLDINFKIKGYDYGTFCKFR